MECPLKTGEGTEVFIAYSARTLPTETEAELRQHLGACASCRRIAEAQEEVWLALDAWTPEPISSTFDEKLYARIACEEQHPWWRRLLGSNLNVNWSWKPAMPVAAACAALLAAFLLKSPVPEHRPQASVQPNIDIEQVERALDDIDMLKQLGLATVSAPAGQPVHSTTM
jgi:hypothetical protein